MYNSVYHPSLSPLLITSFLLVETNYCLPGPVGRKGGDTLMINNDGTAEVYQVRTCCRAP